MNGLRFAQNILEKGWHIGQMGTGERTWIINSSGNQGEIVEPVKDTIMTLIPLQAKKHKAIMDVLR